MNFRRINSELTVIRLFTRKKAMFTRLGQIVRQKREEAGLTLQQFALLAGLPAMRLQELEQGICDAVSFDLCQSISHAMATVTGQRFILQDLWLAWSVDNYLKTISGGQ